MNSLKKTIEEKDVENQELEKKSLKVIKESPLPDYSRYIQEVE